MTARLFTLTDDGALFDDAAKAAKAANMLLIGNGRKIVISPICPPGWFKIAVKIKTPNTAHLEPLPCAA